MTTISLEAPLRSLRALCGLSHRTLGERLVPPVSDVAVIKAEQRAERIKLATLAAYARAAGWRLWMDATPRDPLGDIWLARCDDLDVTVAGARALLAALGLEMTLAVEPAPAQTAQPIAPRWTGPCEAFSVSHGKCQRNADHDGKHRRGRSEWG